jgi:hypothetical protein
VRASRSGWQRPSRQVSPIACVGSTRSSACWPRPNGSLRREAPAPRFAPRLRDAPDLAAIRTAEIHHVIRAATKPERSSMCMAGIRMTASRRRSSSLRRMRRPCSCALSTRFSSRRNSMRSRCSHSIQPTNTAMIKGSGSTHGAYAKAASVELSDITSSSIRRSCVAPAPKSTGTSFGEGQAERTTVLAVMSPTAKSGLKHSHPMRYRDKAKGANV